MGVRCGQLLFIQFDQQLTVIQSVWVSPKTICTEYEQLEDRAQNCG